VCYHKTKNHLPKVANKNMLKHFQNETLQLTTIVTFQSQLRCSTLMVNKVLGVVVKHNLLTINIVQLLQ
jgi:hypothetical protein